MLETIWKLLRLPAPELAREVTFAALGTIVRDGGARLERFGTEYGGWYAPVDVLSPDSVVYSVGVGEDVSFDLALIERFGCVIHAFDPTPRARIYVERRCAAVAGSSSIRTASGERTARSGCSRRRIRRTCRTRSRTSRGQGSTSSDP